MNRREALLAILGDVVGVLSIFGTFYVSLWICAALMGVN
jgi:hypothetical protein